MTIKHFAILITFIVYPILSNTMTLESSYEKAQYCAANAPLNCFAISVQILEDHQAYPPRERFMKALDIYYSIKNASQTKETEKNAIEDILIALKSILNRLYIKDQTIASLQNYKPNIACYRETTDLSLARKTANTSAWHAVGKLICADKLFYSEAELVKETINNMERIYAGMQSNPQLKRKIEYALGANIQFHKQRKTLDKILVPGQQQITDFFKKKPLQ